MYCVGAPAQGFTMIKLPTQWNQVLTSGGPTLRRLRAFLQKVVHLLLSIMDSPLNDKFVTVGNLPPFSWVPLETDDILSSFHISVDDTANTLKSINLYSAAGPDEIPSWFLREISIRGFIPSVEKC